MSTGIFLGVKRGRRVGLTTLPPYMSRMSENVGALNSRNPNGLHGLYRDTYFTLPIPYLVGYILEGNSSRHGYFGFARNFLIKGKKRA
jgi:hypothetical protein